ncbi:hypothetical protein [Alicyclobacillus fastidiosus]|nr:hypothetical protein [Alicyclobacillus fastidiosus]GMA65168.1 hypothetical protein GCM10025859_56080 [Alicyclobacillus fastidiosus]
MQFAKYIAQAMEQVMSRTKMPAIFAPTQPTFQPQAAFVGVSESASDWNYTVRLYATPTSVPLNDPSIGQLSAASFMGMFSGKYYGSHEAAMKELASAFYVQKVGPASSIDTGGVMKQYSTGQQYNTGGSTNYQLPQDVIEWQMGRWKIDVFGAPSIDFINEAKQVDSFIQTHALPPTDGRILINPHATGNPVTQIGWVFGNELFECDCPSPTMTQILDALRMAVSMREYDSDKVTP